ncbi:MAG TPA: hypothetical protein VK870_16025 [Ignavibacteriaceae bacterium]|nr:hypothetical protein [Ignavibacteriaceae bacterium]
MKAVVGFLTLLMVFAFSISANADGKDKIKSYFSKTAIKVNTTELASEKREILNESFQNMLNVIEKVQNSGLINNEDQAGIDHFKAALQEKQDELNGTNGFERVPDAQLNAFSNYMVQDMEQASITISLLALVVIAILLVVFVF